MKKNTIKAFTLVEMLIVIVIIGILIAALMPRMQSAQGRARDVSRKNALSQIQTAIVTSQQDKGEWPQLASARAGMSVRLLENELTTAGMSSVPGDPLSSNTVSGLGTSTITGEYMYMVTKRNGTADGGFVLMAKTEVEGGSNWIYCPGTSGTQITNTTDLKDIYPCTKLKKANACKAPTKNDTTCEYVEEGQLRYILTY